MCLNFLNTYVIVFLAHKSTDMECIQHKASCNKNGDVMSIKAYVKGWTYLMVCYIVCAIFKFLKPTTLLRWPSCDSSPSSSWSRLYLTNNEIACHPAKPACSWLMSFCWAKHNVCRSIFVIFKFNVKNTGVYCMLYVQMWIL